MTGSDADGALLKRLKQQHLPKASSASPQLACGWLVAGDVHVATQSNEVYIVVCAQAHACLVLVTCSLLLGIVLVPSLLSLTASELERRYREGMAVYEEDMTHRPPGDTSSLAPVEAGLHLPHALLQDEVQQPPRPWGSRGAVGCVCKGGREEVAPLAVWGAVLRPRHCQQRPAC